MLIKSKCVNWTTKNLIINFYCWFIFSKQKNTNNSKTKANNTLLLVPSCGLDGLGQLMVVTSALTQGCQPFVFFFPCSYYSFFNSLHIPSWVSTNWFRSSLCLTQTQLDHHFRWGQNWTCHWPRRNGGLDGSGPN